MSRPRGFLPQTLIFLLAGVFPVAAVWQDDVRARLRAETDLVVVPVAVKDAEGNLINDLRRDEFRILENGVEQEILLFSADPWPLSAVVLIDNGLSPRAAEQVQRSLGAIAGGFIELDEVALGRFEAFFDPLLDFTSDNDKLHDRLRRLTLAASYPGQGSGPMTSGPRINSAPIGSGVPPASGEDRRMKRIDDAVNAAAVLLESRPLDRRRIVLIVSDGANSRNNSATFDGVLHRLLSANIAVYAVGVSGGLLSRPGSVLSRYARATGGDFLVAESRTTLESLYSRLTEEARNLYTLAYRPPKTDRKSPYRDLDIRVRRIGLNVRARQGYYTPVAP